MTKSKVPKRYSAEPSRLYDFMHECVVYCPKCKSVAIVTIPYFQDYKNSKLLCTSCHFSEKTKDRIRYRTTFKNKCANCLESITKIIDGRKNIPSYVNIICPACKNTNKIKENWEAYILKYNETGIIDPAFGLPLWYQEAVKENIIWAFNDQHLTEIKKYVTATLRERTTDKFKMTMVERLPDFIKSAKNRDEVIKAIEKMEYKISQN
ncbi:MAG: hypothetical protein ABI851_12920 [Saprospiraceae bacterium]